MIKLAQIQAIKKALPHGAQTQIARELGISHNFVSMVLNGRATSQRVLEAAIEKAEEAKRGRVELMQRVTRLSA